MGENVNERLLQVKMMQRKKDKLSLKLQACKKELDEKKELVGHFRVILEKEKLDVEKLSGLSLTSLLYTLTGSKEDRLDKEKQEWILAKLKYEEACKAVSEMESAIQDIYSQLGEFPNLELEYQKILEEKEQLMKSQGSPLTNEVFMLSNNIADIKSHLKELKEAIDAGNRVLEIMENAIESLDKAKGWGTFDTFFGGGIISTAIKHNHLDEAQANIHDAQSKIRAFQKELLDIDMKEQLHLELSGILKFADYFFDGLIVDWAVQNRIKGSLEETEKCYEKIDKIVEGLKEKHHQQEIELENTLLKKQQLLES